MPFLVINLFVPVNSKLILQIRFNRLSGRIGSSPASDLAEPTQQALQKVF